MTGSPSLLFLIIANFLLFLVSSLGVLMNIYLFYRFSRRKGVLSGFYKLCVVKTIPNAIVCASFLFWSVPLSTFRWKNSKVNRNVNVFVGQLAGAGAYIFGPCLHVCMAGNRFSALYFSMQKLKFTRYPITFLGVVLSLLVAILFTIMGLPKTCGFLYLPETLEWVSEDYECAAFQYNLLLYCIFGLAVVSNTMNLSIAGKLLFDKVGGMSKTDSARRRKKFLINFAQSVLQDCLHVMDMINSTYTYQIYPALWFQFMCLSLSFLSIHTLDGCVMFYFHTEVHPKWMLRKTTKSSFVTVVSRVVST